MIPGIIWYISVLFNSHAHYPRSTVETFSHLVPTKSKDSIVYSLIGMECQASDSTHMKFYWICLYS